LRPQGFSPLGPFADASCCESGHEMGINCSRATKVLGHPDVCKSDINSESRRHGTGKKARGRLGLRMADLWHT